MPPDGRRPRRWDARGHRKPLAEEQQMSAHPAHHAVDLDPPEPGRPGLALALALLSVPGVTIAWDLLPAGGFYTGVPLGIAAIVIGPKARRRLEGARGTRWRRRRSALPRSRSRRSCSSRSSGRRRTRPRRRRRPARRQALRDLHGHPGQPGLPQGDHDVHRVMTVRDGSLMVQVNTTPAHHVDGCGRRRDGRLCRRARRPRLQDRPGRVGGHDHARRLSSGRCGRAGVTPARPSARRGSGSRESP